MLAIVLLSFSIGGFRAGLIRGWQKKVGLVAAATMAAAAVVTPLSLDGSPVGLLGFGGFLLGSCSSPRPVSGCCAATSPSTEVITVANSSTPRDATARGAPRVEPGGTPLVCRPDSRSP